MKRPQQKRVAARFARMWKRQIKADEGRRHQIDNSKDRAEEFIQGISMNIAVTTMVIVLGVVLIILWLFH